MKNYITEHDLRFWEYEGFQIDEPIKETPEEG